MAKKEKDPDAASTPQTKWRYVGPSYDEGILMPGDAHLVRPVEFDANEIEAFLDKYPDRVWFEKVEE